MMVLWLIAFSTRPAAFRPRAATGSLGSRAWSFYACMGSSTPQGTARSRYRAPLYCLPYWLTPSAPCIAVFGAQFPSPHMPLSNASSAASRLPSHGSGSGWFATPFLCDSCIPYSTPVYPDAIQPRLAAPQRSLAATKSAGMSPGVADRGSAPRKSRCGGRMTALVRPRAPSTRGRLRSFLRKGRPEANGPQISGRRRAPLH